MDIPLDGSSCLLFWNVAFFEARKTGGKPSEQGREPTMFNSTHMWSQNRTHIWVGGERSHHCTIPVSLNWSGKISSYAKNCTETLPWTRVSMDGELVKVTKLLLSLLFSQTYSQRWSLIQDIKEFICGASNLTHTFRFCFTLRSLK